MGNFTIDAMGEKLDIYTDYKLNFFVSMLGSIEMKIFGLFTSWQVAFTF